MSIRNHKALIGGLWDWNCLDGCFGSTAISASDIDGVVERNGHFLFLESKPDGYQFSGGQGRLLHNLGRVSPKGSVLIVWGEPGEPVSLRWISPGHYISLGNATLDDFRRYASHWFDCVNSRGWEGPTPPPPPANWYVGGDSS